MTDDSSETDSSRRSPFGEHAELYSRYRPTYPPDLYEYLVDLASPCRVALDCATGNGQAAVDLAEYVQRVIATDVSPRQLEHAIEHPRVEYRRAPAENTGLGPDSVDLVTIATALHWFDLDEFYAHLTSVVREGGVVAAWSYRKFQGDEAVERVTRHLVDEVLVDHWDPRLEYNWDEYQTIPFPFDEVPSPDFAARPEWTLEQFLGFVSTWSGVRHHIDATGANPLEEIIDELEAAWGDPAASRTLTIPLHMRVGIVRS